MLVQPMRGEPTPLGPKGDTFRPHEELVTHLVTGGHGALDLIDILLDDRQVEGVLHVQDIEILALVYYVQVEQCLEHGVTSDLVPCVV